MFVSADKKIGVIHGLGMDVTGLEYNNISARALKSLALIELLVLQIITPHVLQTFILC